MYKDFRHEHETFLIETPKWNCGELLVDGY